MRGRRLAWALWWAMVAVTARAADPVDDLSFERRRWTLADGAPSQAYDQNQTSDGLMWFASPSGLYSFDGVKFKRRSEVYGHKLLSPGTTAVHALSGGRLLIGYAFGGASLFSPQGATHYVAGKDIPFGTLGKFAVDDDGNIYASTTTAVVQLKNNAWVRIGENSLPAEPVSRVRADPDGTLWAFTASEMYALPKGARDFVFIMKHKGIAGLSIVGQWMHLKNAAGQFIKVRYGRSPEPIKLENAARYEELSDGPQGTVIATRDGGFVRLAQRDDGVWYEAEFQPPVYGSGGAGLGLSLLIDREGNLWRTVFEGVEKIRLHRFHQLKKQDGFWLAQRGLEDEIWISAISTPLTRYRQSGAGIETTLPFASAFLRAAPDHVWVGGRDGLWEFKPGSEYRWELPEHLRSRVEVQALAPADDGSLLVSLQRNGLWRFA